MLIKVEISSFAIDPMQNLPLIILKENNGERTLPIAIGSAEASAIAIKSLDVPPERPLTIDLAKLIMEELHGSLKRVVIYDLNNQIFYAHLHIATHKSMHIIDCRPSDAIAIALRCECDIFVEDRVFEKSETGHTLSERERLKQTISQLDTLDFGRYYLD